jgi:recombination protein RecT
MSNEVTKREQPVIKQYLDKYQSRILEALPKNSPITATRMASIVMQETQKNPALLNCRPLSLFGAVIQSAQLGLTPGGSLRQSYLVPYGKECQLILGYAGMVTLASRSGKVRTIQPRAVFEGDLFDYEMGLNERLEHRPGSGKRDESTLTHVYAIAHLSDGGKVFDVMTRAEVDEIRKRSPASRSKSSPWHSDFIPMAQKTVLRRLFKYLPVDADLQQAITLDQQADAGVSQGLSTIIEGEAEVVDEVPAQAASKKRGASAKVREAMQEPEPEPVAIEPQLNDGLAAIASAKDSNEVQGAVAKHGKGLSEDDRNILLEAADKALERLQG